MKTDNLVLLAEKVSTGVATEEELAQFNAWYLSYQEEGKSSPVWEHMDKRKIEAVVLRAIEEQIQPPPYRRSSLFMRRIAAAVLMLLVASGAIYWVVQSAEETTQNVSLVISNDVEPGKETAVLTLGDGQQIILNDVESGIIAMEGSTSIEKTNDGLVSYQAGKEAEAAEGPVVYNTISTPKGGKYKVVLPDRTEVWLNAMSSIRFPTRFGDSSRDVEISGEVYFDVTSQPDRPFRVQSEHQEVLVLGTIFNIKAYPEENYNQTTLVEGSVEVRTKSDQIIIQPGQQVAHNRGSELEVETVDTSMVTAWRHGLFQFWNTELDDIMRQLSRWYDVEVTYLNSNNDLYFTGFISRDVTISNVLQMLEATGNIKFGLEDREVVVQIDENGN